GKIYGLRTAPTTTGWFTGGPFVSHNHLAAYLNLGVGFAVAFLILASQKRPAMAASKGPAAWGSKGVVNTPTNYAYLTPAYAVGMILFGMLFSHSRGGFLAMIVSGVLAAVILRPKNFYLKGLGSVLVLVPLLLLVVGSVSPFLRLASILDLTESGYTVRFELWRHVFPVWLQHPYLGTGLGSFAVAAAPYADFRMADLRFFSHAENEYLQMLVEAGVVGLALTLLLMGGIARLAARAYKATTTLEDRGMVLAGIASCIALAFQSFSDFPIHIPGITVPTVILVGYLCRIGLDGRGDATTSAPFLSRALSNLASVGMIALSVPVVGYEWTMARAELLVVQAGMPFPKTEMPSGGLEVLPKDVLEARQAALLTAVRLRPNWWEGHYRLGMNYLGIFELTASEWLKDLADDKAANDPNARPTERLIPKADTKPEPTPLRIASSSKADPIWIHLLAHSTPPEKLTAEGGLLTFEPVRDFLVPAAHEFLEARRCCPSLAAPHLRLASLDYLFEHGEPTAKHVERTLRLAGSNSPILDLAAQLALQVGDRDLAARCWHQSLEVRTDRDGWIKVADAAGSFLTPERILKDVVPDNAGIMMRFADRLYAEPEAQAPREMFLKAALKLVPQDTELSANERLWLTSQIQARLDDRKDARPGMEEAISNEPMRSEWRHELIAWLLLWGDPEEAHRQALTGTALDPSNDGLKRIMKLAVEAKVVGPERSNTDPRGQPSSFGNASQPAPTK
ncbi:O-antigen ligase family protein, partial [Singulisphaera rosea]